MKSSVLKQFCEFERKGGVFPLLPVSFKKIGIAISILAIGGMIIAFYQGGDLRMFYKDFCMHLILVGLFILALSIDKNEDERIKQLRYRAFAFVLGTALLLIMPFILLILNGIFDDAVIWEFQSFFFIISSFLFYYLMYFQIFKKQL